MSVPKEIWRVVDLLWRTGMDTKGLFLAPGLPADVVELRECIDTGDGFPPGIDPLAVAQVLLDLLSSLREPVVPCSLFPSPELLSRPGSGGIEAAVAGALRALSSLHFNTLVYIVRFAREVLAHSAANGTTPEDLAFVLSRCMLRRLPHDEAAAHASAVAAVAAGGAPSGGGSGGSTPHGDAATVASAAAAAAASSDAAGGGDDESGPALRTGGAFGTLSQYADKGTRWEPSMEEQEAMSKFMLQLLAPASGKLTT